jgi:Ner family transcriptional regulator
MILDIKNMNLTSIEQKPALHPENIKAELRKQYGSLDAFGKIHRLSGQSISQAITTGCSIRVEMLIAKALRMHPHVIWPSRWTGDGKPYFRRGDKASAGAVRKSPNVGKANS